jgi:hypothetical protein
MTLDAQTPAAPESTDKDKEPAWYREQLAAKDAEIADRDKAYNKMRVKLLETTFKEVGLDPTKGLGLAIAERYEGEPDVEELRNFAVEKYQWEPPTPENPIATEVTQAQGRVSAAVKEAESTPVEQIDLDIAQAEERGDFAASMSLKLQKFRQEQGI